MAPIHPERSQGLFISKFQIKAGYPDIPAGMPIIFVKGLTREELQELKRLKWELGAETWRELLLKISRVKSSLLDRIPPDRRWEAATEALTHLVSTYSQELKERYGWEGYYDVGTRAWASVGKRVAQMMEFLNPDRGDASAAHEMLMAVSRLVMGPELRFEVVEASRTRSIARVVGCPWYQRMLETGQQSFCEPDHEVHSAFCSAVLNVINPKLSFRFDSTGFPNCRQIVELANGKAGNDPQRLEP